MYREKSRERRARKTLIKAGFIKDFYYIKEVLESCRNCSSTQPALKAYMWGFKRLDLMMEWMLEGKDELSGCHIRDMCISYRNRLRDVYSSVLDEVAESHGMQAGM